jgi:hypothetical protein
MGESMDEEAANADRNEERWIIDLDWYQSSGRSFSAMAERCLCDNCRKKLKEEEGEIPADKLLAAIKDCCSKQPDFITGELPVLESIFRILLANGNQPLDMGELGKQLSEWRGGYPDSSSGEKLSRLLTSDRYYGFGRYEG